MCYDKYIGAVHKLPIFCEVSNLPELRKCAGSDWLRIYKLYMAAFPAAERKPFSLIMKMTRKGTSDTWGLWEGNRFRGLAITINGPTEVLLDYYAISENARGKGLGSAGLALLAEQYRGRGLFVEIESPYEPGPDQALRRRRKAFYLANGLVPMKVMMRLFGVKMELLGLNCRLDLDGYKNFYRDNYGPWAAGHIDPEVYPEGE